MFKSTTRIASASLSRTLPKARATRRFVSTAPPHQKSRSWKSSAARWTLAGGLVYYYNTASVFAEEPSYTAHALPETSREKETYHTVESAAAQRRAQSQVEARSAPQSANVAAQPDGETTASGSPEALEEEASEQGAFNEETGEINWDCPCLGGMAYGPCGEQFRAAFSCFVYSKEEPKGIECIENFKAMQNCFREHPDVYGSELEDDDDAPADGLDGEAGAVSTEPATAAQATQASAQPAPNAAATARSQTEPESKPEVAVERVPGRPSLENPRMVTEAHHKDSDEFSAAPESWHDSRDANQKN